MVVTCAAKAVIGSGLQRSYNVQSATRNGTGAYTVTLKRPAGAIWDGPGFQEAADGIVLCTISGAFKMDADFTSATTIAVQILNLSGAAADPPNGTVIKLLALQ
jgi:hypothetical protein